ncbi:hypothetical protein H4582DRAFT_2051264 [Lactarius indigo]|nr:hypothetical protein H4582DRAFT_2051264 [Lactarius indigo]
MQNEYLNDSDGSGDPSSLQSYGEQSVNTGFSITPRDGDILLEYLDKFQEADTHDRTRIVEKAMGELYHLRPANTPFDKKDARKAYHPSHFPSQKIHKWFYNHYVHPKRQYIKFTRKWSARNAFYHLNRDEVLRLAKETSGTELGSPAFIGALQDATTALWNELSIEDQEEYQESAREWSEKTPPKNIQSRYAHCSGMTYRVQLDQGEELSRTFPAYRPMRNYSTNEESDLERMASSLRERIIQDFQSQLYKTCGICSIVLTAYKGEDNDLKIGFILQDGKDFRKFCPDWKSAALWQQWAQFGMQCFAKDTVKECPKRDLSKTITTPIPLVFNADGFPELPKVVSHDGYKAKVIQTLLRDYCTAHICESFFNSCAANQTIPWGSLSSDPSAWIDEECIPYDFEWKDPSKIQIDEVFRLLDHWRDRQDQGIDPLMWVPTCPLFNDTKQPTIHKRNIRRARPKQSDGSDEESFDLHYNEDSNPQGDKTDDSLDESSVHDEPSDHSWAAESPPLHGSQDETDPENDGTPDSPGYKSSNINRSSSSDIAGPSDTHHVQDMKELNTSPLIEKRKRFIKVSEKIKNLDTGRGAAKVHPSYLAR